MTFIPKNSLDPIGLARRLPAAVAELTATIVARDNLPKPTGKVHFGEGASPGKKFNNAGFLALFAILGAAIVGATIWFFVWARNGGLRWEKEEWEDYKSTVLRRSKGPDGRTLSQVTRSRVMRELDEEEAAAEAKALEAGNYSEKEDGRYQDSPRRQSKHSPSQSRDRLMEYRVDEKPAEVGGINRPSDATRFDAGTASFVTNSDKNRSSVSSPPKPEPAASPKGVEKRVRMSEPDPKNRLSRGSPRATPRSSRPVSGVPAGANKSSPVVLPKVSASAPSSPPKPSAPPRSYTHGSPGSRTTASSYYNAYRAAAAAHDAARPGARPTSYLGLEETGAGRPAGKEASSQAADKPGSRASHPPPASSRFLRTQERAKAKGQQGAGPEDEDERLSSMLPPGEIHPNESASQIGTRAYWAAKRESAKTAGGYRRYSRT